VPSSAHVSLRRVCLIIVFFLVSVSLAWAGSPKAVENPPGSVVAIGDVHGDFDDFVAILQKSGLIDAQHHWIGGKTTLVQVGDLLDRGPKPRDVMDLLMALETAGRTIPSILITGVPDDDIAEEARAIGAIEVFGKPIDFARLLQLVAYAVQ